MAKLRFEGLNGVKTIRKNNALKNALISAFVFIVVLVLFLLAVANASRGSAQAQMKVLDAAIEQSVLQAYITEGRYPDSFEYLKENYGITYDESRFRVDYVVYASNMKPEVTIIDLEAED